MLNNLTVYEREDRKITNAGAMCTIGRGAGAPHAHAITTSDRLRIRQFLVRHLTRGPLPHGWFVRDIYRVIAKANSTARITAATASGQKLSLGELSTGLYCRTIKPVPEMPGAHVPLVTQWLSIVKAMSPRLRNR